MSLFDKKSNTAEADRELTYGEKAVGVEFNPSNSDDVHKIKTDFAALINVCDSFRKESDNPEVKRMYSLAITGLQEAQMWAVKANTWKY